MWHSQLPARPCPAVTVLLGAPAKAGNATSAGMAFTAVSVMSYTEHKNKSLCLLTFPITSSHRALISNYKMPCCAFYLYSYREKYLKSNHSAFSYLKDLLYLIRVVQSKSMTRVKGCELSTLVVSHRMWIASLLKVV